MSKFTPSADIDMSKEKEWPYGLGLLDWDNTNIVFTKRSLIEFLKYTGTTVDTNFSNIAKLPRYAQIGKFTPRLGEEGSSASGAESTPSTENDDGFKPTRRVRTAPGGPHTDIFGSDFQDEEDALSRAPPSTATSPSISQHSGGRAVQELAEEESGLALPSAVNPRVPAASAASDFGEFKPSRRVREGPGGKDSISGLFG
ncbi:hypothetical protein CYLTODRAFT_382637 [Cylindrobasidium torrendii FP15055 ss-10]|uniref:Uncharacterized protein n=1 Tax=Cylindrobasidium torrendii FP15055 ss-10 TaxID=1314674 RepID=A0A0D7B120_9AGAR|nr:hypothetical protein CYLTODRAFT_382637 [Cylindrobasidium torrendii FP15055 ss-10]